MKGVDMKYCIVMGILLTVGCQQHAKLDSLRLGMTLTEVQALPGSNSLKKIGENADSVQYSYLVDGGIGAARKYHSVLLASEPYILTFDADRKLVDISFDQTESVRRTIDKD